MQNVIYSINVVAPVFIVICLSAFLYKIKIINDNFTKVATELAFKIALPVMTFRDISRTNAESVFDLKLLTFSVISIVTVFLLLSFIIPFFIKEGKTRGAFIHGVFRSNYGILGLAIVNNAYGQTGFSKSTVLLSVILPVFSILAVITLAANSSGKSKGSFRETLKTIVQNPLIIATSIALPFMYFKIPIPTVIDKTIDYFGSIAIPIALIGMGGSFKFSRMDKNKKVLAVGTLLKIIILPLIIVPFAYLLGFRGLELCILFVLFASPSAITSFIMTKAMGGDGDLAANIVMVTTLGSVVTLPLGIFILRTVGWM